MSFKIIDNYLPTHEFKEIQNIFFNSQDIPWYFHNYTSDESEINLINYQFVHMLVKYGEPIHSGHRYILPILRMLNPIIIDRIKINLIPITESNIESGFHLDNAQYVENDIKYTVGIFYLNTNNGSTELEDGTKIQSMENRMVFMSGDIKHRGITATDSRRSVINFSFINSDTHKFYETKQKFK
jgi:hypothetical protein